MTKQISDLPSKIKLAYDVIKHRLWLKHLRGLALMRYGRRWWLPNDVHGQYMLQAMLAAGLTGPDAQRLAPWIGPQQLEDMIQSVDSRTSWDGDALGNMVELTADERERGEFWSMRPCDLDWCRVQEQRRERKRESLTYWSATHPSHRRAAFGKEGFWREASCRTAPVPLHPAPDSLRTLRRAIPSPAPHRAVLQRRSPTCRVPCRRSISISAFAAGQSQGSGRPPSRPRSAQRRHYQDGEGDHGPRWRAHPQCG
jgi:hypothetical protein